MEHTKLPWKVIEIKKPQYVDGFVYGIPDVMSMMHYGNSAKAKANVELIVKRVNMHDELVEALKHVQRRIEAEGIEDYFDASIEKVIKNAIKKATE